ncbi:MAG: non-hydrolyzing UDP-N-acetylglucosamine 2-epimerase [Elusimicrobiales bacterium]
MADTKKILVVMGTRPEVIKLAPLVKELNKLKNRFKVYVCSTGQHKEMLYQASSVFGIKYDFDLGLMKPNQRINDFLEQSLSEINKLMDKIRPDITVVQGDTITATTVALSSYYSRVPVAHVEAGLRSHDKNNPFPEEANRIIVDHISDFLFVPTKISALNLIKEGLDKNKILITGNTVIDALSLSIKSIKKKMKCCKIPKNKKIIVLTLHRRESFGVKIENILKAVKRFVEENEDVYLIYPVHPNPNVKKPAYEIMSHERIKLIDPLPYLEFVSLISLSDLIMTDSGGVQEEAVALNKRLLILRDKTERKEAVMAGCAKLIGTDPEKIVFSLENELDKMSLKDKRCSDIYGDGKASKRIAKSFLHYFWPGEFKKPKKFVSKI